MSESCTVIVYLKFFLSCPKNSQETAEVIVSWSRMTRQAIRIQKVSPQWQ